MAFHTREECAELTGESCDIPSHPRYSDPTTDALKARNDEIAALRERVAAQDEIIAGHQEATKRLRTQITTIAKQRDGAVREASQANHQGSELTSALATMTIAWLKRADLEARIEGVELERVDLAAKCLDLERRASQWDTDSAEGRAQVKRLVDENTELRFACNKGAQELRDTAADRDRWKARAEEAITKLGGAQQTASIATAAQLETGRQNALLYNIATAWAAFWAVKKNTSAGILDSAHVALLHNVEAAWSVAEKDGIFKDPDDLPF